MNESCHIRQLQSLSPDSLRHAERQSYQDIHSPCIFTGCTHRNMYFVLKKAVFFKFVKQLFPADLWDRLSQFRATGAWVFVLPPRLVRVNELCHTHTESHHTGAVSHVHKSRHTCTNSNTFRMIVVFVLTLTSEGEVVMSHTYMSYHVYL